MRGRHEGKNEGESIADCEAGGAAGTTRTLHAATDMEPSPGRPISSTHSGEGSGASRGTCLHEARGQPIVIETSSNTPVYASVPSGLRPMYRSIGGEMEPTVTVFVATTTPSTVSEI